MTNAKILLIDDEPLVLRTVTSHLNSGQFENVAAISDPREAIAKIEEYQPDLVLLDIIMPEISGLELLSQIKSKGQLARIKIVVLSSAGEEARWDSLDLGANDFIDKPVDRKELLFTVRNVLRSPGK